MKARTKHWTAGFGYSHGAPLSELTKKSHIGVPSWRTPLWCKKGARRAISGFTVLPNYPTEWSNHSLQCMPPLTQPSLHYLSQFYIATGFGVLKPVQRGPTTSAQTAPDAAPCARAVLKGPSRARRIAKRAGQ